MSPTTTLSMCNSGGAPVIARESARGVSAPSLAAIGPEAGAHFAAPQNRIYNRVMGEVVLVTVHGGPQGAVCEAARRLVSRLGASSGSVPVRAGADDRAVVAALDTEHEADAMIT